MTAVDAIHAAAIRLDGGDGDHDAVAGSVGKHPFASDETQAVEPLDTDRH